jgi:hypothetical protein
MDVTQAYQTVEAKLTQAVALTPPVTPTHTATQAITPTATMASTATISQPTSPPATSAPGCDQAGAGTPIDVTIPDDTVMAPGEQFTKTWRIQNIGTCTWDQNYSVVFVSGNAMAAPNKVSLTQQVAPGELVDISIDMQAPQNPESYQGNWKLMNASGQQFGIGAAGGVPFWVRIVVEGGVPLPTATGGTQGSDISGQAVLSSGSGIDLDSGNVDNNAVDVVYNLDNGKLLLAPVKDARIGGYGAAQPDKSGCEATSQGSGAIDLNNMTPGDYMCHTTGSGLPGWIKLSNVNKDTGALTVQFLTWATP